MQPADESSGVDMQAALSRVGGDEDLLREVAQIFLDECPGLLDKIRFALQKGDQREVEMAAHSLKGAVGNFGTGEAYTAALGIEAMARHGKLGEAGRLFPALELALEIVNSSLAKIIARAQ